MEKETRLGKFMRDFSTWRVMIRSCKGWKGFTNIFFINLNTKSENFLYFMVGDTFEN